MGELQPRRVEKLASEPMAARRPVLGVARHRVVDRGEMDTDLMGAPRLQARVQEGVRWEALDHLEMRARVARTRAAYRHPGPAAAVPSQGSVDRARAAAQVSLD